MMIGKGLSEGYLSNHEVGGIVTDGFNALVLDEKKVLVIIPDSTRTMPMAMVFELFDELLQHRVKNLDYLVALGTHRILNDAQLSKLVGRAVINSKSNDHQVINHEWYKPDTFVHIGTIPAKEISQITQGMFAKEIQVQLNKLIFDYDQLIICGPVFPHEVAGFSGGNKYFFPGIAGPEIINFTHWLGALITSYSIIGTINNPVRVVIDRAAEFVKVPTSCFGFVVTHQGVAGLYCGETREAWEAAAKLSAQRHIIYKDKPFTKVISIMPTMYDDLWTAAKGMYKLEPIVADGGEVIIYAPHIHEVSYTHGKLLNEIGYHCRDYYLAQWEKFKHYPGGVLAHSTHLKGSGTYDQLTGVESARIQVTLATGITAEHCNRINLGYLDPEKIDINEAQNRENEGILVVPNAGETLYRIRRGI